MKWLPGQTIEQLERDAIFGALKYCEGNLTTAASALGISYKTIRNKIAKYREEGFTDELGSAGVSDQAEAQAG